MRGEDGRRREAWRKEGGKREEVGGWVDRWMGGNERERKVEEG